MHLPLAMNVRFGPLRAASGPPAAPRRDAAPDRRRNGHAHDNLECLSLCHLERHPADRRADMDSLSLSRIEDVHTPNSDMDEMSISR